MKNYNRVAKPGPARHTLLSHIELFYIRPLMAQKLMVDSVANKNATPVVYSVARLI